MIFAKCCCCSCCRWLSVVTQWLNLNEIEPCERSERRTKKKAILKFRFPHHICKYINFYLIFIYFYSFFFCSFIRCFVVVVACTLVTLCSLGIFTRNVVCSIEILIFFFRWKWMISGTVSCFFFVQWFLGDLLECILRNFWAILVPKLNLTVNVWFLEGHW